MARVESAESVDEVLEAERVALCGDLVARIRSIASVACEMRPS